MNGTDSLFSTIDLRSFSNLWFWLMLAVAWSNVTHYVMGVPFDMVQRAKRKGLSIGTDAAEGFGDNVTDAGFGGAAHRREARADCATKADCAEPLADCATKVRCHLAGGALPFTDQTAELGLCLAGVKPHADFRFGH